MTIEEVKEHQTRLSLGEEAKNFLNSKAWTDLVKPILDSMIIGLKDATTIDVSADKKAAIEVKSRTLSAEYIQKIELLLRAHVTDGDASRKILEKSKNAEKPEVLELYRVEE